MLLKSNYHISKEFDTERTQYYQELIGMLRWAIDLARIDILLKVSFLSNHLVLPRVGLLEQIYHIFEKTDNSLEI